MRSHTTVPGLIGAPSSRARSGKCCSKTRPHDRLALSSATSRARSSRRLAGSTWPTSVSIDAIYAAIQDAAAVVPWSVMSPLSRITARSVRPCCGLRGHGVVEAIRHRTFRTRTGRNGSRPGSLRGCATHEGRLARWENSSRSWKKVVGAGLIDGFRLGVSGMRRPRCIPPQRGSHCCSVPEPARLWVERRMVPPAPLIHGLP
jgi:hypothetical protein